MWKFDNTIANIFESHAKQHIPNYDAVIDQCVDVCNYLDKNTKIIDVGCAIGETLNRLQSHGFTNLHGVDSSSAMISAALLDKCSSEIFTLHLSDKFPKEIYDVVLMNWTLHFIENKIEYLKSVYDGLSDNGLFILTDKTSNDELPLKFYHQFKSRKGVSENEIQQKAESLVNVMFIHDVDWYLKTLRSIGFKEIYIMNAYWCFTSFICKK